MPRGRPIIPCNLCEETRERVKNYAEALNAIASQVGAHGLSDQEFWETGIFRGAIERLRGQQAASTKVKHKFVEHIFNYLQERETINKWEYTGAGERYDYEVTLPDGRISIIETKGCLDGNNTTIFQRPPQADEFIIWSLCQNATADPRHNAWSGLHTRLSSEIIHSRQLVDGVVIWDMLCNTIGRPCPKAAGDQPRLTRIGNGKSVPPPCIYLLPRSVPDPRNNPNPRCHTLEGIGFLHAIWSEFEGNSRDVVTMRIKARTQDAYIQRKTEFFRDDESICSSRWTAVRRARA